MRRLVPIATLLLILLAAAPARAETAAWWRSFYGTVGHRQVAGVDLASGTSFGAGYRFERDGWGLDATVLNVQYGRDEGVHCWGRLAAYVELERHLGIDLWAGAGVSYGTAKGWAASALPRRSGHGPQLDLIAGHEWARLSAFRFFTQLDVTVPLFRVYDIYRSTDSATYVLGIELAAGIRF